MRPAAIGFDFDHTLGIDNKLERVAFLHLANDVPERDEATAPTVAQESARIDALLAEQRSGAFSIEEAVARFASAHGLRDGDGRYAEAYKAFCLRNVGAFVVPMPGVQQLCAAMRERAIRYAILSNGWSPLQSAKARCVDFDGPVLASAAIGVQKPERAAFARLCEELGSSPAETWYVGDSPQIDVAGAHAAGLRTVWFDAEGVEYPEQLPAPHLVIHSLHELMTKL